ncbi:MAG TPA: hypothetical protein VIK22_14950 [Candidatus Anoxymicrobiaceae bacterium]
MAGSARGDAQLKMLMRLASVLDTAGEGVLGKGAPAMMYQAGRDAGLEHRRPHEPVDNMEAAMAQVLTESKELWMYEGWQEPGSDSLWSENGERCSICMIFRRCPLMALSRSAGTTPGGILCQVLHGYIAGSMEVLLEQRVEMKVGHCGPRACKVQVELRS